MAREVIVILSLVVPEPPPDTRVSLRNLRGRELAGVPGSVVTKIAVHDPETLRSMLAAHGLTGSSFDDPQPGTGDAPTEDISGDHLDGRAGGRSGFTAAERAQEIDADYGEAIDADS